jgi:hypothetical protein
MKAFLLRFIFAGNNKTYLDLHVNFIIFLSDFKQTLIFSTHFNKNLQIRHNENPTSGSRADTCGRTHMTKLISVFASYAKAPHNEICTISDLRYGRTVFWIGGWEKCRHSYFIKRSNCILNATIISRLKININNSNIRYTYFTHNKESLELFQQLNEL